MTAIRFSLFALAMTALLPAQERAVVASASRIIIAPRTTLEGDAARIAFRAGKIIGVGSEIPRDLLEGAKQLHFEGATIVPGFVVAHDYLDLESDLGESITAFTPSLEAGDAFDPFDKALVRHARGGVTCVGLAPSSTNTLAGLGAAVQWRPDGGEVIKDATYLKLAIVDESLNQNRFPTSRMGAADLVRNRFHAASNPLAPLDLDHRTVADVLSGSRKLAVHARKFAEIVEALDLCAEFELEPIVIGADEALECVDSLRRANASVALSPLDFDDKLEVLQLPAELERAGVALSFIAKHPEQLRRSAAIAVRGGLSREAAIAALTRTPAEQLGIADSVGSLRRESQADFTVYSGDPIDLTSKPIAVFVNGTRVPAAEKKQ